MPIMGVVSDREGGDTHGPSMIRSSNGKDQRIGKTRIAKAGWYGRHEGRPLKGCRTWEKQEKR